MTDFPFWDLKPGKAPDVDLAVNTACLPNDYQFSPCGNPPELFAPNTDADGAQDFVDWTLFDYIQPATQTMSYALQGEFVSGAPLQVNPEFPWPPDPVLQPPVNLCDTCLYGAQLSPSGAPLTPQTPSDTTVEDSSPCPSAASSPYSGSQHLHQYQCKDCGRIFKKSNDLKRHSATVHGEQNNAQRLYECPCGHTNARKDNYIRHHLGSVLPGGLRRKARCTNGSEQVSLANPFKCLCGETDRSASAHLRHVTDCTRGRHGPSGRPRRHRLP